MRHLLQVEIERLEVARRIERERDIVFPETTVIIRDIQKLHAAICAIENTPDDELGSSTERGVDGSADELLDDLYGSEQA